MAEPFVIMEAMRLGYEILTIDGKAYFRPKQKMSGPYSSLEEAAKAAINDSVKRKTVKLENEDESIYKHQLLD